MIKKCFLICASRIRRNADLKQLLFEEYGYEQNICITNKMVDKCELKIKPTCYINMLKVELPI